MTDWVPSEIELLEYVEGDLGPEDAERVRRAVSASPELARSVAALERSRAALRSAPSLELPEERYRAALDRLPRQERGGWSLAALTSSPRRLLLVLTPVAAAAVLAIALTTTLGGGDETRESAGGEALQAQTAAAATTAAAGAAQAPEAADESAARAPLRSVQGPARRVALLLRARGLDARAVNGTVEVRGAAPEAVRRALAQRAAGGVQVFVLP